MIRVRTMEVGLFDFHRASELIDLGEQLSVELTARAQALLGEPVRAFGKAAIVGEGGELEHAAAILHPKLGAPLRVAVEKGAALVPSAKKLGTLGTAIDGGPRSRQLFITGDTDYFSGPQCFARSSK